MLLDSWTTNSKPVKQLTENLFIVFDRKRHLNFPNCFSLPWCCKLRILHTGVWWLVTINRGCVCAHRILQFWCHRSFSHIFHNWLHHLLHFSLLYVVVVSILSLLGPIEHEIILAAIAQRLFVLFKRMLNHHRKFFLNKILAEDDYNPRIDLVFVFLK